MAGYRIDVNINTPDVAAAMRRLVAAASNLSPAWDRIGVELVTGVQQRFASSTDPQGRPWAALAPATIKQKAKSGKTKTLIQDGHLMASIHFRQVAGEGVDVGSDRPYAAIHQFGGSITRHAHSQPVLRHFDHQAGEFSPFFAWTKKPKGATPAKKANVMTYAEVGEHQITIPARPFLGLDDQDHAMVLNVLSAHLSVVGSI